MAGVFVIGGTSSGKSVFAERIAVERGAPRLYVATAEAFDDEMRAKARRHQERRAGLFETVEEALDPARCLTESHPVVLVDCLTNWYNNLFFHVTDAQERWSRIDAFASTLGTVTGTVVVVTNELGWGVIPDNALARAFVDFSGRANERIQQACDEAYLVVAGIPWRIK